MNSKKFREELKKIMPGYKWTVRRRRMQELFLEATGIQTAGFNRMSTLLVIKRKIGDRIEYHVKSSKYSLRAPWLGEYTDETLARALRGLQDYYTNMADKYFGHASDLEGGRK